MAYSIVYAVVYLWSSWALYILIMGIYRAHLSNRLYGINKLLGYPIILIGYLVDVISNFTIASILFLEPPKEFLVTDRLIRLQNSTGWRSKLASLICNHILDPFDPTGNHC